MSELFNRIYIIKNKKPVTLCNRRQSEALTCCAKYRSKITLVKR